MGQPGLSQLSSNDAAIKKSRLCVPIKLLRSESDITEAWLTWALCEYDPSLPGVESFVLERLSTTKFDVISRLTIEYKAVCAGPRQVLFKCSTRLSDPQWQDFVGSAGHREASAYLEFSSLNVCRVPDMYCSVVDKKSYNFLLQDVGALPAAADNLNEPSLGETRSVIAELALLHGCYARYSPVSAPAWLIQARDCSDLIASRYRAGLGCIRDNFQSELTDKALLLMEELSAWVAIWHGFDRHMYTVTHGDARAENMLFLDNDNECTATLIGWKLVGLRNPMFDIASLLSNDLSVVDRRCYENGLIDLYLRLFERSGIAYEKAVAEEDYRFNLFAPLIFNVCAAGFLAGTINDSASLITSIQRNCQALIDWQSLTLIKLRLGDVY